MQRVLSEILRRSCDTTPSDRHSKKRKSEILLAREDGKYAEQEFRRESRGARPGLVDWQIKRRCTNEWEGSAGRRLFGAVCE
jgi:hypothetical protein